MVAHDRIEAWAKAHAELCNILITDESVEIPKGTSNNRSLREDDW